MSTIATVVAFIAIVAGLTASTSWVIFAWTYNGYRWHLSREGRNVMATAVGVIIAATGFIFHAGTDLMVLAFTLKTIGFSILAGVGIQASIGLRDAQRGRTEQPSELITGPIETTHTEETP